MSQAEPLLPHPTRTEPEVAAADPGTGSPATAPGTGVGGEDPDARTDDHDGPTTRAADTAPARLREQDDPPFRTPHPDDVRRPAADDAPPPTG
ncbi:hypothetical protein [Cellulomonas shaoxiangyii]|uniref:Uncharacterized protein n=1 Tax=Cellulomonas shaoxiangyii TaxID=2566013 RepID=A0A4P7SFW5_9CELL|nr:hypothetical protein [Cellulomonas shaoxiangyii]QCB93069.1 hypothetical protein E5225_05375 [Cellulomonas shaoxiangyii]TGY83000.1 hypothetical protein E5226_12700 [Cellulomonas shaoxiangyii]